MIEYRDTFVHCCNEMRRGVVSNTQAKLLLGVHLGTNTMKSAGSFVIHLSFHTFERGLYHMTLYDSMCLGMLFCDCWFFVKQLILCV